MEDVLRVQADAQNFEVSIPIDRISHIVISDGCHYEWVRLDPKEYEKRFCLSRIKSAPCCEHGLSERLINNILNRLHDGAFGAGGWLNMERRRLQPLPPGQEPCVERECWALSILRGTSLESIRAELDTLSAADQTTEQPEKSSDSAQEGKRKRESEPIDVLRSVRKRLSEVSPTSENETDERKKLMHDVGERICLEQLVSSVQHGISLLIKDQKTRPPPVYLPFAELSKYRQRCDGDKGEELRQVMTNLINATTETAKQHKIASNQAKWTQYLISENSRLKERCVNPKYASGDDAKTDKELKRLEKRSVVLNQIVNKLRKYVGGHAWGIFSALIRANAVVSGLRKLLDDRVGNFVESAVDRLKDCGLETIPDNTPTINIPAVLSWLQTEVDFRHTCRHLYLGEFAHEDPRIATELDQLALEQEALDSEAPDYDSTRSDIERRASMVITPPLSRLRALHFSSIQSDQCECSQHKTPDASGSGTSNQSRQSPTQATDHSDSGSQRCSTTHLGTPTTHFIPENSQRPFSEPPPAQPTPPDTAGRHVNPGEGGFSNGIRTSSEPLPPMSQKHGVVRPQEIALQDPRSTVELGDEVNPARNGSTHEPQPSPSTETPSVNTNSQTAGPPPTDSQTYVPRLAFIQSQDQISPTMSDYGVDIGRSSASSVPLLSHGVSGTIETAQADSNQYSNSEFDGGNESSRRLAMDLIGMNYGMGYLSPDGLVNLFFNMNPTNSVELTDMGFNFDATMQ